LQHRMTSREFAEWMAFYEIEPFGDERGDLRMAILAALIANAHRDPKRRKRAYKPADFMPKFGRQSLEEQIRIAEMLKAAFS